MTTTNLHMPRRALWLAQLRAWLALRDPLAVISIIVLALTLLAVLLRGLLISSSVAVALPTPALEPIIMIATQQAFTPPAPAQLVAYEQPAPRYVVAFAAPDGAVLGPIPAPAAGAILARYGDAWLMTSWQSSHVWIRAADLEMGLADLAPQAAPALIAPAVEEAIATPAPGEYQTMSDPVDDFYTTPPVVDPAFQQSLIGADPDALACDGSVFCGGLTNRQAQETLERQRNQQP